MIPVRAVPNTEQSAAGKSHQSNIGGGQSGRCKESIYGDLESPMAGDGANCWIEYQKDFSLHLPSERHQSPVPPVNQSVKESVLYSSPLHATKKARKVSRYPRATLRTTAYVRSTSSSQRSCPRFRCVPLLALARSTTFHLSLPTYLYMRNAPPPTSVASSEAS